MAKETVKFGPEVKGINGTMEGKLLTITIDTTQDFGPSKSGKTDVVATTQGTARLGNGLMLGLNLNRSKK
jgi:hypothetical protein